MQSIDETIETFFRENEESLKGDFPGINQKVIFETYKDLIGEKVDLKNLPDAQQMNRLEYLFSKILEGIPLAYITNQGHFFGREFFVDSSVLIPRFETEELVAMSVEHIKKLSQESVVVGEVGVGSGCIGLTLLAECFDKKISLHAYDISQKALEVAAKNLEKLSYCFPEGSSAKLLLKDRLDGVSEDLFDVIVSNPPYIKKVLDNSLVHHQVKEFEPFEALFLDDDTYDDWFIAFFKQVEITLKANGSFFMEGHENHLQRLKELATNFRFEDIKVTKDLSGRDRFLSLKKI